MRGILLQYAARAERPALPGTDQPLIPSFLFTGQSFDILLPKLELDVEFETVAWAQFEQPRHDPFLAGFFIQPRIQF